MSDWNPGERRQFFEKKETLRRARAAEWEAKQAAEAAKREAKTMEPVKPAASRFTTQAAIDYGRSKGWRLIDRENYNHLLRRHRDTMFATDCLFDDGGIGMVGIQGAGRWEKAAHWRRFVEAGGPENAKRRCVRVLYAEFVRDDPDPVLMEWWS